MYKKKTSLTMTTGYKIATMDGSLIGDSPCYMATELFYPVSEGDHIECVDRRYVFSVAFFEGRWEEQYLYTYDYKKESAWVVYREDLSQEFFSRKSYEFKEDGFCRVCVMRVDGSPLEERDFEEVNNILYFYAAEREFVSKSCFEPEIRDTVEKVEAVEREAVQRGADSEVVAQQVIEKDCGKQELLRLCLLTDSHYTVNGTWEDTVDNIKKVLERLGEAKSKKIQVGTVVADEDMTAQSKTGSTNEDGIAQSKIGSADEDGIAQNKTGSVDEDGIAQSKISNVDGIVHLGDFTDGMTSKTVTSYYIGKMLEDLRKNEVPVWITLGNHDSNYFRGNKQRFTKEEQLKLFGLENEYYYVDYKAAKIRCLFLASYDADVPVRYGFSKEQVEWVKDTLAATPAGYKVLVFSHEAPLEDLDYWARLIRNGRALMEVLEEYNAREDAQILAYIHGHTHAEYVYRGSSFPIISIGCNKCEYYPDKKPKGAYAYMRKPDTVTQDLWDILVVDSDGEQLHFVRFGAGEDRIVDCHKRESTWRTLAAEKKRARTTKIWAHRGASGFAPENTIPAFEVAKALDVDGIELDVQMTRDGELVVIHDEKIDRTSDGKGWVKDYTLKELRKFNFGKAKPQYGFVTIPTLREVYELFRDTDYVINVELKTSVVAYDGSVETDKRCIEEKVHALTVEMGMEERVIYSSFNHSSILKMQQYVTKEQTAFLFSDGWIGIPEYAGKYGVNAVHSPLFQQDLAQFVKECHEKGMKVHVWTVNEEEHALVLAKMGADAIITNHPGKMKKLMEDD